MEFLKIKNYIHRSAALIDIALRLIIITVKGLFVFVAAKYIPALEFGKYVALAANIAFFQYLVAGDFTYKMHRHFFSGEIQFSELLETQKYVFGFLFLFATPFFIYLLPDENNVLSVFLCLMILFFETCTNELQRHLVALSKFTSANFLMFLKSVSWMIPFGVYIILSSTSSDFNLLIKCWLLGTLLALIFGLFIIKDFININAKFERNILHLYFRSIGIVLIGTLLARSLFSVDRIIVEKMIGLLDVGIYGVFVGVAAAFVSILDAGVLARSYPLLVETATTNADNFKSLKKTVYIKIFFLTIMALCVYQIIINALLTFIGEPKSVEYINVGINLILAYGIYSLSFPLNCLLYAHTKDKWITGINLCAIIPLFSLVAFQNITLAQVSITVVVCAVLHLSLRYLVVKFISSSDKHLI